MKSSVVLYLLIFIALNDVSAQQSPKRELRGAWITTFSNIDWPVRSQTPQQQKNAFIDIIDHHQATGINTVFVQIRSQCDAFYPSALEPWSADLTGRQGVAPVPYWDPLEFMIKECRKRNMEIHAWLNPYRAISSINNLSSFANNHVVKQHPEWLLEVGVLRTLDPGLPQVRTYILNVIKDIVNRYDVDGVHFDDYFYPSGSFNDDQTFNTYPRGFSNRADWRRDNVNILIKETYEAINDLKPWVKFGVSPSGIYRNSTNPAIGTPTAGMEHYNALYADSKKWIAEGWVDYLAPQVYWYRGQSNADYTKIVPWWNNNSANRHIYIGQAGYKVNDATQGNAWLVSSEIPNQIRLDRRPEYNQVHGQIIYNTKSLRVTSNSAFRDSIRLNLYNHLALKPLMPWKDNTPPASPKALTGDKYGLDSLVLTWIAPAPATHELDKVKAYAVYKSANATIDTLSGSEIVAIVNQPKYVDTQLADGKVYQYKVTSLDRYHNESLSSNTISTLTTSIDDVVNSPLAKVKLYPNPSSQQLTIQLFNTQSRKLTVQIADLAGKVQLTRSFKRNTENIYLIDFNNQLTEGYYVVNISGQGLKESIKIIVL